MSGKVGFREGELRGGLPFLAAGDGPALVVFPGLSAENANPRGFEGRFESRRLAPLARHFSVYLVSRRPGLQR